MRFKQWIQGVCVNLQLWMHHKILTTKKSSQEMKQASLVFNMVPHRVVKFKCIKIRHRGHIGVPKQEFYEILVSGTPT